MKQPQKTAQKQTSFKFYTEQDIQQTPYTQTVVFSNEHTPHRHTFYEFTVVLSGRCLSSVDNNPPVELSRGDLFFVTPDNFHQLQLLDFNYVHRDFFISAKKLEKIVGEYFKELYEELPTLAPKFHYKLSDVQLSYLQEKAALFNEHLYSVTPEICESLHTSLILDVLGMILSTKCEKKNYYPKWLDTLIHRLNNLEFINQSIPDIIKASGYAHSYVCRFFKKYTGQTLISYHNAIKVRYSTRLLETYSVLEIAALLNWDNPKNYTLAFKKIYHMTPSEYKKSMKEKSSSPSET